MSEELPRYVIAERALNRVKEVLDHWDGSDWGSTRPAQEIRSLVEIAEAHLRMAGQRRDRRRPRWLAKVTSGTYGRGFNAPGDFGKDPDPHLCFVVEITDGSRPAQGKRVEVQASDEEMELLATQLLGMVALRKRMKEEQCR